MHENARSNNVRNEAHEQEGCCTPAFDAQAALKVDQKKINSGEYPEADAAQKPAESGCCCGSKSPKR